MKGKKWLFGKEASALKHDLKISISREPPGGGIVRCRTVTLRERLLDRLLGARHRMTILVPGDSVQRVSITEQPEDADEDQA